MASTRTIYRNFLISCLVAWALTPAVTSAQGNLPCPPVDVNRADIFTSVSSTKSSFSFLTMADFQNGLSTSISLRMNVKGGKTYEVRYRFLNGTTPVLGASGQSMDVTNALKADGAFGAGGWGILNVQIASTNQVLSTNATTLGRFKARCAVTNGDFQVSLKALGTAAGVNSFFKKGATPPLDYGAITVEFQLWRIDDNTLQDARSVPLEVLIGDVLDFSISNATTNIDATPFDYINGIEVTVPNQLIVSSNNSYDIAVSTASSTLVADGNGATGNVNFADLSLRVSSSTPGMGTITQRTLSTSSQNIATSALGGTMTKPISLVYRLQNSTPKNLTPGTYSGTIYITVTEN